MSELPKGYQRRINHALAGVLHHAHKAIEVAGEFLSDEIEVGDDEIKVTISRRNKKHRQEEL